MEKAQLSQAVIKETNKRKIIRAIWGNSPISRVSLAQLTNLNKATISNLMTEIESEGMIANVGRQKSDMGRSANLLMLNKSYGVCATLMIRTVKVEMAVGDIYANILWQSAFSFSQDDEPMQVLEKACGILNDGIKQCGIYSGRLLGIGIGVGSLIRKSDDMVYAVHSSSKWYNVPVGEYFRRNFNEPVYVDTVANCAMLGEKYFGVCRGVENALQLTIGHGIGGSLLINGEINRGASGFAGDVSHFVIDPNGQLCGCGKRGCWELTGSALALPVGESFASAAEKALAGDVESITALNGIGVSIGRGIANLVRVLNPGLVVLGGDIVAAQKWIMNPCRTEIQAKLWPFVLESFDIKFSGVDTHPMLLGGMAQVIEQLFRTDSIGNI